MYQSEEKIKISNIERNDLLIVPKYLSSSSQNLGGVRKADSGIFDFVTSRAIQAFPENVFNVPLTEVELERLSLLQKPRLLPDPVVEQKLIEEVRASPDFKARAFLNVKPNQKAHELTIKPVTPPVKQQQVFLTYPSIYPNLLFSYSLHG